MSQYYFAVASLPMLFYGEESGTNTSSFIEICREACSSGDFSRLHSAVLTPSGETKGVCRFLEKWNTWETALRNELVMLRAKDRNREPGKYMRENDLFFTEITDIAREAYNQETPLLAEEVLNQARWARLEEMEIGHHFDIEKLMVYYLKLQLKERKALFSKIAGEENFTRIYERVHESDKSSESAAGEL